MSSSTLPELNFIDTDPEQLKNDIITTYEGITGKSLYPSDPVRLFLLSIAQMIIQQRVLINYTAKQNLLRYASGSVLDHKGDPVNTPRFEAISSQVTVRFHIAAPNTSVVAIPVGTRVSPDGTLFFVTTAYGEIKPGDLYTDMNCECLEAGTKGNGYIPGQINLLVDPVPWISNVENVTESDGGKEREDDEHYRERIRNAPEAFSTAGPSGAYEHLAKAADPRIIDVIVYSPSPGTVEIRPLLEGGEIPSSDVLTSVELSCSDRSKRPLTDKVQVLAPEQVSFNIDITYWISDKNITNVTGIQESITEAVRNYELWQKSKLGRDINESELIRRLVDAGAKRVEVRTPVYTKIESYQVAIVGTKNVVYGGIENE